MSAPSPRAGRAWPRIVAWGLGYFAVGFLTVAVSRHVARSGLQPLRLAAWAVSAVVFGTHIWYEARRAGGTPPRTALRNALAVALGGFLLAAVATVHALSAGSARVVPQLMALVAWPVLLGIPSFLVAWGAAAALGGRKSG